MKEPESWRQVKLAELENLYVKEKYRSQGIGKELSNTFIKWAKENHADRVVVSAFYGNEKAIAFYKTEGFTPYDINLELHL